MAEKKETKKPETKNRVGKNQLAIIGALVLLCVFAVIVIVIVKNNSTDVSEAEVVEVDENSAEFVEANYKLAEDATQDQINSNRLLLASIYANEGNYEKSNELLNEVSEPSELQYTSQTRLLADNYYGMGDFDKAKEFYLVILNAEKDNYEKLADTDPTGDYELGLLYERTDQRDLAIVHYQKVVDALDFTVDDDTLSFDEYFVALKADAEAGLERLR